VSIGLPIFNGARFIRQTLPPLLAQTYTRLEIIICDNASTDDTAAICQEFAASDPRIRYVRNPHTVTVIRNFRRTFELATGEYFMWAAIDDLKSTTIVEETVRLLAANPSAVMAHGPIRVHGPTLSEPIEIAHDFDLRQPSAADRVRVFTENLLHNGMVFGLFRRDALLRAAPYRQHVGHDYLMCLQMCVLGPIERVPSHLVSYLHRYGTIGTPMYTREPITLRDLLIYRGVRRRKCWVTLLLGSLYILRARRVRLTDKVAAMVSHLGTFSTRYRRELCDEIPFLLCSPLRWLLIPVVPPARKAKATMVRHGLLRA
jgi:hypothetical protein